MAEGIVGSRVCLESGSESDGAAEQLEQLIMKQSFYVGPGSCAFVSLLHPLEDLQSELGHLPHISNSC